MKKEVLTISNITKDFEALVDFQMSSSGERRFSYIIPITLLSVALGIVLKNIWIALLVFSVAVYHTVRYIIDYKRYKIKKKAILNAVDRDDVCLSVERFSHISEENIHEPYTVHGMFSNRARARTVKTVSVICFSAGTRWRIPKIDKHYAWSKEHYMSAKGLENTSVGKDEFYLASLQGYPDIAYAYPCKFFVLDEKVGAKHILTN